jgi:basic membrane protein A and related proteins
MRRTLAALAVLLLFLLAAPGCAARSADCAKPEVFCVGLVTEVGKLDDRAANQAAWQGIQQARSGGVADWAASIETVESKDYEANIRFFAEAGYDAVVTVGADAGPVAAVVAGDFPRVYFLGADQRMPEDQATLPNLAWLVFPEDQLGFLAGAMAALSTKSGQIGAVCGSDALPPMDQLGLGFAAGASYVNPGVLVTVSYNNGVDPEGSDSDPVWGAAEAEALVQGGVDVLFGCSGETGSAAVNAAAQQGAYGIGAEVDQYFLLPVASAHLLTSVLKMVSPGVEDLLREARENQVGSGAFRAGVHLGTIGLAPFHELDAHVPEQVRLQMADLIQALASGEIQVGTGSSGP